jgi:hypothetical protein
MAAANTSLQVSELDFEEIRNNLKAFLSSQSNLQDYDYEGSVMGTLLDVLAYNTHYSAFYLNMIGNEAFLDTAQQRDSVVSRAKELGYTPISARGASANVILSFTGVPSTVGRFRIAANSTFTSTIDDVNYTFVTPEAYTVINNNGSFVKDILITEGEPLTHKYVVSSSSPTKYILPNLNVDTRSIAVRVQASASDTTVTTYTQATNILEVGPTSKVFFLQESADQKYEIVFGDGILGNPLRNGNIVIIDYRVSNGTITNGANNFSIGSLGTDLTNSPTASLTLKSKATGGREVESVESIKFNAPKNYETQNRAIIADDYSRILLSENSDLESVITFGGENAEPPIYGKVIIAGKPLGEEYLTESRKHELCESIRNRTSLAVDPSCVDADYLYVVVKSTVNYDALAASASAGTLETNIKAAITSYNTTNLNQFKKRLRFSRLSRIIDNVDTSIISNQIVPCLQKRFTPSTNLSAKRVEILYYKNPINKSSLISTSFTYDGYQAYLGDDGLGTLNIFRYNTNKDKINIVSDAGTVNYSTGKVSLNAFAVTAYDGIEIKISAAPTNLDVVPTLQTIITIDTDNIGITMVAEN